jgi:PIN domain nuclease of toxin-antitoxin system
MTSMRHSPTTSSPHSRSQSKLLLDTRVFLWWCQENSKITKNIRAAVAGADNVYVSLASAWEAAIKVGLGKLRLDVAFAAAIVQSDFEALPISFDHAARVAGLPHHHGDPFDRMLIAQAQVENLAIVTHDSRFEPYDVPVIWA